MSFEARTYPESVDSSTLYNIGFIYSRYQLTYFLPLQPSSGKVLKFMYSKRNDLISTGSFFHSLLFMNLRRRVYVFFLFLIFFYFVLGQKAQFQFCARITKERCPHLTFRLLVCCYYSPLDLFVAIE